MAKPISAPWHCVVRRRRRVARDRRIIDANPTANAAGSLSCPPQRRECRPVVIEHATRALGAGPLCRDAHFARMVADLPVFLRQSHAERDQAALGRLLATEGASPWLL